jgi:branched-chain amino acid transport system permease protein
VSWSIGGVSVRAIDILVVSVAVVLMVALQFLVQRSKLGRAMRAVAQDSEAAALMGVNVNQIISITFFIGASLAGAAAIVYGLYIGTTVFYVGFKMGLFAFTAAVLGGIGNMAGAMLGGLLIGLIESLVDLIPNSSNGGWGLPHGGTVWPEVFIFSVLILILVFRPSGLLGQNTPDKV